MTGKPILDVILDRAGQKGTGRWAVIEAQHLGAPVTTIEAAVAARNLSSRLDERRAGAALFGGAPARIPRDDGLTGRLEQALLAGKVAGYAQGFGLLAAASAEFAWSLPLPRIARIWRAGCIIRSAMLDDMAQALEADAGNLMFAPRFAEIMRASHGALRAIVAETALAGIPTPALAAAIGYFDMLRTARSTANLLRPSATSSARTASSASTPRASSTARGPPRAGLIRLPRLIDLRRRTAPRPGTGSLGHACPRR